MGLKEIVSVAINSLDAGVNTKEESIKQIMEFVESNYTKNDNLEELPVEVFELRDSNGKVTEVAGVRFEHLIKC